MPQTRPCLCWCVGSCQCCSVTIIYMTSPLLTCSHLTSWWRFCTRSCPQLTLHPVLNPLDTPNWLMDWIQGGLTDVWQLISSAPVQQKWWPCQTFSRLSNFASSGAFVRALFPVFSFFWLSLPKMHKVYMCDFAGVSGCNRRACMQRSGCVKCMRIGEHTAQSRGFLHGMMLLEWRHRRLKKASIRWYQRCGHSGGFLECAGIPKKLHTKVLWQRDMSERNVISGSSYT